LLINSPFITETLTRAEKTKTGGLLGSLFSGGDDEPMTVKNVGFFKGIVRCYNEEASKERKDKIDKNSKIVLDLIRQIYELETEKPFDFDFKKLKLDETAEFDDVE